VDWDTARSVTLVAAANHFLAGHAVGDFWPKANVFHFANAVRFAGPFSAQGWRSDATDAADPNQWFAKLRGAGAQGLLLAIQLDCEREKTSGLPPIGARRGHQVAIIEIFAGSADRWRWSQESFQDGLGKGWSTTYNDATDATAPSRPMPPDMAGVTRSLEDVLSALIPFTRRNGLEQFSPSFEHALACLRSDHPLTGNWYLAGYEQFLHGLDTQRLFAAAKAAHVFGGMGSWNDSGAEREPAEFNRLTLLLLDSLRDAVIAVANSTFRWP
jgi:hypothetical protein